MCFEGKQYLRFHAQLCTDRVAGMISRDVPAADCQPASIPLLIITTQPHELAHPILPTHKRERYPSNPHTYRRTVPFHHESK